MTATVARAAAIVTAHKERRLLEPFSVGPPLSMAEAYDVQRCVLAARLENGERLIGWKIGYTSSAMREQMGVNEPNFGPLTDAMVLASGEEVDEVLVQPRVEPEILVVLGDALPFSATRVNVAIAVKDVRCALEVVDSVWRDYRFRIEDNTSDGSSAAHVVVGPPVPQETDLSSLGVTLRGDGEILGEATGSAAMGHPFDAVRWLNAALLEHGTALRAGDVVLTGGLTAAAPLTPRSKITAGFTGIGEVVISRGAGRIDISSA